MASINKNLMALKWLIGKWQTIEAKAFYPTIKTLHYNESMEFATAGEDLLKYNAIAHDAEKGELMHTESGYLRIKPDSEKLAMMVAHNVGVSEISEGEVKGHKVILTTRNVSKMSFYKGAEIVKYQREWELLSEDTLKSTVSLQTTVTPFQEHLNVLYKLTK